jgi:hypothetical protein
MVLELAESGADFRFYQIPGTTPGTQQTMPVLTTATALKAASAIGTFLNSEKGRKILEGIRVIWANTPQAEQQRLGETIAKLQSDMEFEWSRAGNRGSLFQPGNPVAAVFIENWGSGAIPKYQQLLQQARDLGGRRVWARHIVAMQQIMQQNAAANPITATATRLSYNPLIWVVGAGALFYFINRRK